MIFLLIVIVGLLIGLGYMLSEILKYHKLIQYEVRMTNSHLADIKQDMYSQGVTR